MNEMIIAAKVIFPIVFDTVLIFFFLNIKKEDMTMRKSFPSTTIKNQSGTLFRISKEIRIDADISLSAAGSKIFPSVVI